MNTYAVYAKIKPGRVCLTPYQAFVDILGQKPKGSQHFYAGFIQTDLSQDALATQTQELLRELDEPAEQQVLTVSQSGVKATPGIYTGQDKLTIVPGFQRDTTENEWSRVQCLTKVIHKLLREKK